MSEGSEKTCEMLFALYVMLMACTGSAEMMVSKACSIEVRPKMRVASSIISSTESLSINPAPIPYPRKDLQINIS